MNLGTQLRSLRSRNGWTLKEMSARCRIPVSTLSKVEHNRLTLNYNKLVQLTELLDIPICDLFGDVSKVTEPTVTARRSIGRTQDAVRADAGSYQHYYLCTDLRAKRMVPIVTQIRVDASQELPPLSSQSGEEYIYVLEGSITVLTEFYAPMKLEVGESIYLDASMGHAYLVAGGCQEATILRVCTPCE